jgi:CRP-like cAMP-binding protein
MSDTWQLDVLAGVPLFRHCTRDELREIARASFEQTIEAGTVLFQEGQTGRECYVIIGGRIRVQRGDTTLATLGAGEAVGELALIDHGPRTATGTAEEVTRLLVLGQVEFDHVLRAVPTLARSMLLATAERLREVDERAFH